MIKILLAMFLFATFAPAAAEEARSLRPVRLSSQATEKSVELTEMRRGLAPQEAEDYTSTFVGAPLMLAFFYALVSSSVRAGGAS
jgi:hypothetical protein